MNLTMARAVIEALIFASSEPIQLKTIAEIVEINEHTVKQLLGDLMADYQHAKKGIQIIEVANGYQFYTHPECSPYLEKLQKTPRNVGLSPAAIETLAIVAYKQPIAKAEIEALRGVSVESSIATLVDKNLIEEAGRKEAPGRPILYRTTKQFLRYFGLNHLDELPKIPDWVGVGTGELEFTVKTEVNKNARIS
ncbi:segregation and condensation protein B [Hydrogenispora ethanolica]|uniref:Segregation and condensation protein B n=1 Tax=Hydrogenispora ethanolica TaxID=1082276 RepID=A0A4R1RB59_HYDET|nr:SMC-Scp complex subunit ScpB [Hydrogenispora ethanolica]TCL62995.1 segregation and condensation protein B [Hydrogenispora ethanolica]